MQLAICMTPAGDDAKRLDSQTSWIKLHIARNKVNAIQKLLVSLKMSELSPPKRAVIIASSAFIRE